jgi:hypothetical protein
MWLKRHRKRTEREGERDKKKAGYAVTHPPKYNHQKRKEPPDSLFAGENLKEKKRLLTTLVTE